MSPGFFGKNDDIVRFEYGQDSTENKPDSLDNSKSEETVNEKLITLFIGLLTCMSRSQRDFRSRPMT